MLTFEENDPPEPLELEVKQVVSIVKSAQEKVNFSLVLFQCAFGQEMLTFLISVSGSFICQHFCNHDLNLLWLLRGCSSLVHSSEPVQTLCTDSLLLQVVSRLSSRLSTKWAITRVMPSLWVHPQ